MIIIYYDVSSWTNPIGSMYAIYCNIYHQYTPNVSNYTIHGSYGNSNSYHGKIKVSSSNHGQEMKPPNFWWPPLMMNPAPRRLAGWWFLQRFLVGLFYWYSLITCLAGDLKLVFSIQLGISSSQLTFIFFRGVGIPPSSYVCMGSVTEMVLPMRWYPCSKIPPISTSHVANRVHVQMFNLKLDCLSQLPKKSNILLK